MAAATSLSPEQRRLRAQAAAYASHINHDPSERARAGQQGLQTRFAREVDPDSTLEPAERARRAELARKAYMARLSLASSRARAQRKEKTHAGA